MHTYNQVRLRKGARNDWRLVFYVVNPATGKRVKKEVKLNHVKNLKERASEAKRIQQELEEKLAAGWNPYAKGHEGPVHPVHIALARFLTRYDLAVANESTRPDTLRTHRSNLGNFLNWCRNHFGREPLCHEIDTKLVLTFLDDYQISRRLRPRTRNNFRGSIFTFCEFLVEREILPNNPVRKIKTVRNGQKIRTTMPPSVLNILLDDHDLPNGFKIACLVTFYCFIRRTELTKLRVKDVDIENRIIKIRPETSKNSREEKVRAVAIVDALLPVISQHIKGAAKNAFIFSAAELKPGPSQLAPKKISDLWAKFRKRHELPQSFQFYSLKDSGITQMMSANVPPNEVRDQARHHNISITNKYIQEVEGNFSPALRTFEVVR